MPRRTTFDLGSRPERDLMINIDPIDDSDHFDRHDAPRTSTGLMELLYVIILSAALDLVPPATPKGIIAFCNIAPSLVAKVAWPYLLRGKIQYERRLLGCCALSFFGMLIIAFFDGLYVRLLGISFASFSSGLGELTFLQLSTTYSPPQVAGHAVGYFASGTGAAGLVGAFLWWEVRGLGVMPFLIPLTYFFLLPHSSAFLFPITPTVHDDYFTPPPALSALPYTPLGAAEDEEADKVRLVKPLLLKYMLPLFCVYLFEYTINQGIGPTLFPNASETKNVLFVFLLVCLEGICGGLAYVNVFYRINHEPPDNNIRYNDIELTRQAREFKIGSIGFADSTGILFASILAVPTEIELCKAQVARGKMLCKSL
ncbi:hypothetical protein H1R20_g9441, partial [Candolleomyces eurysporus]